MILIVLITTSKQIKLKIIDISTINILSFLFFKKYFLFAISSNIPVINVTDESVNTRSNSSTSDFIETGAILTFTDVKNIQLIIFNVRNIKNI